MRSPEVEMRADFAVDEGFVGRIRELEALRRAADAAEAGRGGTVLVSGEPGIGKTRLASRLVDERAERGARVVWARAWEGEGAPSFWPWVQVVRDLVSGMDRETIAARLGPGAPYVASVVPDVRRLLAGPALPKISLESESARFFLFDAIGVFLRQTSAGGPLVIVLDDLHWSDLPSLHLLKFLASVLPRTSILTLGLYRDVEVRQSPERAAQIAAIARDARTLALGAFDADEVNALVEAVGGRPAPAGLVEIIRSRTGGNPFFVDEMIRLLAAERPLDRWTEEELQRFATPDGVRDAVANRIRPLAEDCRRLLDVGSVLGREIDLAHVAAVAEMPVDTVTAALAPALAARILAVEPDGVHRYAFTHDLVRETLYEGIAPLERARLHLAVAEHFETLYRDHLDLHLSDMAHHFAAAAAAGDAVEKAVHYCRRAGDRALELLAYEEAAQQYQRALDLLALGGAVRGEMRCDLLLGRGEAEDRAGLSERARATLEEAAGVARSLGDGERLARVATVYANVGPRLVTEPFHADESVIRILREAIADLPEEDSTIRARLMARLATELYWAPVPRSEGDALSRRAVEMARRLEDPETLGYALLARGASVDGVDSIDERMSIADEILGQPAAIRDRELGLAALLWRIGDRLQMGNVSTLEADAARFVRGIEELREPRYAWLARSLETELALMRGRFDEAEALAARIPEAGPPNESVTARFWALTYVIRRDRGGLEELADAVRSYVASLPRAHAWQAALACLFADTGRAEEARVELDALGRYGFADISRDMTWATTMAFLSEAAFASRAEAHAAVLRRALEPYARRNVLVGDATAFFFGPVAYYLGILSETMGRLDAALEYQDAAIVMNERVASPPFLARALLARVRVLYARRGAGDVAEGDRNRARATELAERLGMAPLLEAAAQLQPAAATGMAPAGATAPETDCGVFRLDGKVWTIRFDGRDVTLPDAKGFRYLAILLDRPGTDVHALEIRAAADGRNGNGALRAGDAGEVLDERARQEYQRRLEELRGELDEAEAEGSPRAAALRDEIDALGRELARALGLGGRFRRAGSDAERARLNVTRTIRSALAKIEAVHPPLGRHFAATVRTGTFCSYTPDPRAPIRWER